MKTVIRFASFMIPALMLAFLLMVMGSSTAVSAQNGEPCPSTGKWPVGCVPSGSAPSPVPDSSPSGDGVPCPPSGAWPAGCMPSGSAPSPAPESGGDSEPCPATGAWPTGCDPSLPPDSSPAPAPSEPAPSAPVPEWESPDYVPPVTHKVSQISALPEGTDVVVNVQVVSTDSFRSGYRFTVADNTGRVTMIIWHSVYDDCEQCNALNIGSELVLSGVTDSYEGEVQIVPLYGGAIRVTKPSFMPGRLVSADDLGKYVNQRAKIEGRITQVNRNDYGVELVVDDGTSEAEVFFWNNNWQRIPDSWQLQPGAVIQAAGTVSEWRGTYSLTPPLPYDVVALDSNPTLE